MRVAPAMPIPSVFYGRRVTPRGVHMQPSGQWGMFLENYSEWIARLVAMHITYVVALTDSDSILIQKKDGKNPIELMFDAGIIPVIRLNGSNLPGHFTHQSVTEQLVELYSRYNAPCFIQYLNEPGDSREWVNGYVPPDWWEIWTSRWREGARQIIERGAMAVLPDGPCFDKSPFPDCSLGIEEYFASGWVAYGGHYYALNRPLDYPYDDAQRLGTPMTLDEYLKSLDRFASDPNWHDPPLNVLNSERARLANPNLTALEDDTCWRGWEKVEYWMDRDLGYKIPHLMTEGGVTPKARAGSGPNNELRYTLPTPQKVAERTLQMYNHPDSPLSVVCPWVLASEWLGAVGWYDDCWFGGAYYDMYGFDKPVVGMLTLNAPDEVDDPMSILIQSARDSIAASIADLEI